MTVWGHNITTMHTPFRKEIIVAFFLIAFLILSKSSLTAQVTIGSGERPNSGALLDLKESDNMGANSMRGLMLPRVLLDNPKSISPILDEEFASTEDKALHSGLIVFNLRDNYSSELCRGVYIWSTDNWKRLSPDCCFQIREVVITNPSLSFNDGETVTFEAMVRNPLNLQDPNLEYEWYLDGVKVKGRSSEHTLSLQMTMGHDSSLISVKAFNLCSGETSQNRTISVVSSCISLEDIAIGNSLLKDNFEFAVGKAVEFYPVITPANASDLRLEWSYGDNNPIEALSVVKEMENSDNGKVLRLTVSNECSSITKEVTMKTYRPQCPVEDAEKIYVTESENSTVFTFDIYGLSMYTQEELDELGVQIQWYKKQNNSDGTIDREFIPIEGANSFQYVFHTSEYFGGGQDICNIGVVVTGAENVMDCPINNSRSFSFKVLSQGTTSNGSYQGLIRHDSNSW